MDTQKKSSKKNIFLFLTSNHFHFFIRKTTHVTWVVCLCNTKTIHRNHKINLQKITNHILYFQKYLWKKEQDHQKQQIPCCINTTSKTKKNYLQKFPWKRGGKLTKQQILHYRIQVHKHNFLLIKYVYKHKTSLYVVLQTLNNKKIIWHFNLTCQINNWCGHLWSKQSCLFR
jgi:hypothetical protein